MLNFRIEGNDEKFLNAVKKIAIDVADTAREAASDVRKAVVEQVTNQDNWNPAAVYSHLDPRAGERYNLNMSGQLLTTIKADYLNTITGGRPNIDELLSGENLGGFNIGIGNIEALEKLKTKREEFGSSGGDAESKNAPYWRFVVFGHRPPRDNLTFVRNEDDPRFGKIMLGKPKMKGTPPTYMFKNGLFKSQDTIRGIISAAIQNALKNSIKDI